jgi:hypothetical protein
MMMMMMMMMIIIIIIMMMMHLRSRELLMYVDKSGETSVYNKKLNKKLKIKYGNRGENEDREPETRGSLMKPFPEVGINFEVIKRELKISLTTSKFNASAQALDQ